MVDFFIRLYPTTPIEKKSVLNTLRVYSLIRYIVRNSANLVLPVYFKISNFFKNYSFDPSNNAKSLIVSFTSFPARIGKVHLVVETILRQTKKPDRIILWLSEEQFPQKEKNLPKNLLKQKRRGLEIEFRKDDLRSHKKYFYVIKEYPNSNFITIDDDIFYPTNLIENLFKYHKRYPNSIIMNRGRKIKHKNEVILPYSEWESLQQEQTEIMDAIPTGIGGVLYFSNALHKITIQKDVFMKTCSKADDLWLFFMGHINNTPFTKTNHKDLFLPIYNKENYSLSSENIGENENDIQFESIHQYLNRRLKRESLNFLKK